MEDALEKNSILYFLARDYKTYLVCNLKNEFAINYEMERVFFQKKFKISREKELRLICRKYLIHTNEQLKNLIDKEYLFIGGLFTVNTEKA